jgi:hypothetical protein
VIAYAIRGYDYKDGVGGVLCSRVCLAGMCTTNALYWRHARCLHCGPATDGAALESVDQEAVAAIKVGWSSIGTVEMPAR